MHLRGCRFQADLCLLMSDCSQFFTQESLHTSFLHGLYMLFTIDFPCSSFAVWPAKFWLLEDVAWTNFVTCFWCLERNPMSQAGVVLLSGGQLMPAVHEPPAFPTDRTVSLTTSHESRVAITIRSSPTIRLQRTWSSQGWENSIGLCTSEDSQLSENAYYSVLGCC